MARINKLATLGLSEQRPTFIGRPVEAIQQTNQILENRYLTNKALYENQLNLLEDTQVEDQNKFIVENRKKIIDDQFKEVIQTNSFEHADQVVTAAAKGIKADKYLKGAVQSYALRQSYLSDIDKKIEDGKLDTNTATQLKTYAALSNNTPIEVDENGVIKNIFSAPSVQEDPNINKQLMDLAGKLKASKEPVKFANGKEMAWIDGAWRMTETYESINEKEATEALTRMIMQDPKNQAWFAQKKRLEDMDVVKRDENGYFVKDEYGNLQYDYSQVDYRNKLARIGFDKNHLEMYAKQFGDKFSYDGTVLNFSTMTEDEKQNFMKMIYDTQYMPAIARSMASSAVAVVDYDVYEPHYYQDQWALYKMKKRYEKQQEEIRRRENPFGQFELLAPSSLATDVSDLITKKTQSEEAYKAAENDLNEKIRQAGIKGTILMKDGVPHIKYDNGTIEQLSKANESMSLYNEYVKNYKDKYEAKESINEYYSQMMNDLPKEDRDELYKNVVDDLFFYTSDGASRFVSDKLGMKTLTSEQWDKIAEETGLKRKKGFGNPLFRDEIFKNKDKVIEALSKYDWGRDALYYYVNKNIEALPEIKRDRINQSLSQLNNAATNVVGKTINIDDDYHIAALKSYGRDQYKNAIDKEGNNIAEGDSRYTAEEVLQLINDSKANVEYRFTGGKKGLIFSGNIQYLDENGHKATKFVQAFLPTDRQIDDAVMSNYAFPETQIHSMWDDKIATDFNDKGMQGYHSQNYEIKAPDGSSRSVTIERYPVYTDPNTGEQTPLPKEKQTEANAWKYRVRDNDAPTSEQVKPVSTLYEAADMLAKYQILLMGNTKDIKVKTVKPNEVVTVPETGEEENKTTTTSETEITKAQTF